MRNFEHPRGLAIFFGFVLSCVALAAQEAVQTETPAPAPPGSSVSSQSVAPEAPSVSASRLPRLSAPLSARQGDPVFAEVVADGAIEGLRFDIRDGKGDLLARGKVFGLPAKAVGTHWGAMAGLGWDVSAGPAQIRASGIVDGRPFVVSQPFIVEIRAFPSEEIALNASNTQLQSIPDERKTLEALAIQAIYARADPGELWASLPFLSPVGKARRSSGFGDRRIYLYAGGGRGTDRHSGIDLAVPVGTPVMAPASGRVVFSGMRIVTGYTMVIEHLPGLYSILMHLSKGVAPVGALVKGGDVVAYSGFTGFATGPHLHWEMRAAGVPVDPDFFLAARAELFPWLDIEAPPVR